MRKHVHGTVFTWQSLIVLGNNVVATHRYPHLHMFDWELSLQKLKVEEIYQKLEPSCTFSLKAPDSPEASLEAHIALCQTGTEAGTTVFRIKAQFRRGHHGHNLVQ